ncbi:MAG TPA: DNA repair protein RecO [Patescibacteria group bacterium]|nr:DNA repair protein RecO [Patescibacteria group bacterium]
MNQLVAEGIVLKRRNSGEADRIITVLTKNHGKMTVKAVGVRKISSKRSSHIEPLNHVVMAIYKGKGIPVLTEITTKESFPNLKNDLQKIGFAYHLCELIDGLCPEGQENTHVFDLLQGVLFDLCLDINLPERIHEFEVALLTTLGYWSDSSTQLNTAYVIESILERRLKTVRMLPKLFLETFDNK